VCVPTIGQRKTLGAALQSLKAQTYPDYEALILDNSTTLEAQQEIGRFAAGDKRVSVLRSETRLPMFSNFQRGLDAARGRYVAFFHDDDVYSAEFLSEQVAFLDANPSAAFAGANCLLIDADGRITGERSLIRSTAVWNGWKYINRLFALGSNLFPMQSITFRRSALPAGMFESTGGVHFTDFVLLMELAERHDVGLIARQLLQLRVHPGQASQQLAIGESLDLRTKVFLAYCDDLAIRWPGRRENIDRLRRQVATARRSTVLWSWANAADGQAARSSRAALGTSGFDQALCGALGVLDRLGVGRLARTQAVRAGLRRAAQFTVRWTSPSEA